jgi:hypothetical protein
MGLRPTKANEDEVWPTHSCVPRSHSCERSDISKKKRVHTSVNTARLEACATVVTGVFNGALPRPPHALRSLAVAAQKLQSSVDQLGDSFISIALAFKFG